MKGQSITEVMLHLIELINYVRTKFNCVLNSRFVVTLYFVNDIAACHVFLKSRSTFVKDSVLTLITFCCANYICFFAPS